MMFKTIATIVAAMFAVAASAASAAEPAWTASQTAHFIIYSKSSPSDVEKLATDLEKYDKLMRMATSISEEIQPVKVRIYEVDGLKEIQEALGLDSSSGVAGFYNSNTLGPFLVTPHKTGYVGPDFGPKLVLHHEYAHHFMLQYFPAAYPGWYVEGFAEMIGSSKVMDDGRIGYGMPAKQRGHDIAVDWVPLQELLTDEKPWGLDAYAQGWAITHFFTFDKQRSQQFRQYLAALNAGKSLEEAAKVFGDLSDLDREARRYVTGGSFEYRPVKVEIAKPVIQHVRPVSAGEAALIPEVIAFRDDDLNTIEKTGIREHERKLRDDNLDHTLQVVQRYPNDPFALYFLSEAEAASGKYRDSESAADRLLAIQPNHVRGLARKSIDMSMEAKSLTGERRQAMAQKARELAARANHLDKLDPLPLLAYYESFSAAGEKAPQPAVEGLMQVVSTLPGETHPRQLLVNALEADHRFAEAIAWLGTLANDPHDSPVRDSAREQMTRLKSRLAAAKAGTTQQATN